MTIKELADHDPNEPITQQTALMRFSGLSFHVDPRIWLFGFSWEPHGNIVNVHFLAFRLRFIVPPKAIRTRALRLVQSPIFWMVVTSMLMLSVGVGIGVTMMRMKPSDSSGSESPTTSSPKVLVTTPAAPVSTLSLSETVKNVEDAGSVAPALGSATKPVSIAPALSVQNSLRSGAKSAHDDCHGCGY